MCVEFSAWQRLNKAKSPTPEEYDERRKKAVRHLDFVCKLYRLQADAGRLFLHEHPAQASSWEEDCVERILKIEGTKCVTMDQCTLGQCDKDGRPVKKPTKWMSNSDFILRALDKRCQGRNGWCWQNGEWDRHSPCHGAVAKKAAIYPFKLCKAILEGLKEEMKERGRWHAAADLVMPPGCSEEADPDQVLGILERAVCSMTCSQERRIL